MRLLGRGQEQAREWKAAEREHTVRPATRLQSVLFDRELEEESRTALRDIMQTDDIESQVNETQAFLIFAVLEAAVSLAERAANVRSSRLEPLADLAYVGSRAGTPARLLGAAAELNEEPERALGLYDRALQAPAASDTGRRSL